ALAHARRGDHAAAVAAAASAVPDRDPAGDTRLALACVYALASDAARRDARLSRAARDREAERLAAQAVSPLEAARCAGYFKEVPRVRYVVEESDFDGLRGREDFRALAARLGVK